VTDGTVNASLPKTADPNALTFEQATELLAARRDMAPAPKRAVRGGGFKRKAASATAPKPARAARAKKKAS
jgi:DNA topoisomerase-1